MASTAQFRMQPPPSLTSMAQAKERNSSPCATTRSAAPSSTTRSATVPPPSSNGHPPSGGMPYVALFPADKERVVAFSASSPPMGPATAGPSSFTAATTAAVATAAVGTAAASHSAGSARVLAAHHERGGAFPLPSPTHLDVNVMTSAARYPRSAVCRASPPPPPSLLYSPKALGPQHQQHTMPSAKSGGSASVRSFASSSSTYCARRPDHGVAGFAANTNAATQKQNSTLLGHGSSGKADAAKSPNNATARKRAAILPAVASLPNCDWASSSGANSLASSALFVTVPTPTDAARSAAGGGRSSRFQQQHCAPNAVGLLPSTAPFHPRDDADAKTTMETTAFDVLQFYDFADDDDHRRSEPFAATAGGRCGYVTPSLSDLDAEAVGAQRGIGNGTIFRQRAYSVASTYGGDDDDDDDDRPFQAAKGLSNNKKQQHDDDDAALFVWTSADDILAAERGRNGDNFMYNVTPTKVKQHSSGGGGGGGATAHMDPVVGCDSHRALIPQTTAPSSTTTPIEGDCSQSSGGKQQQQLLGNDTSTIITDIRDADGTTDLTADPFAFDDYPDALAVNNRSPHLHVLPRSAVDYHVMRVLGAVRGGAAGGGIGSIATRRGAHARASVHSMHTTTPAAQADTNTACSPFHQQQHQCGVTAAAAAMGSHHHHHHHHVVAPSSFVGGMQIASVLATMALQQRLLSMARQQQHQPEQTATTSTAHSGNGTANVVDAFAFLAADHQQVILDQIHGRYGGVGSSRRSNGGRSALSDRSSLRRHLTATSRTETKMGCAANNEKNVVMGMLQRQQSGGFAFIPSPTFAHSPAASSMLYVHTPSVRSFGTAALNRRYNDDTNNTNHVRRSAEGEEKEDSFVRVDEEDALSSMATRGGRDDAVHSLRWAAGADSPLRATTSGAMHDTLGNRHAQNGSVAAPQMPPRVLSLDSWATLSVASAGGRSCSGAVGKRNQQVKNTQSSDLPSSLVVPTSNSALMMVMVPPGSGETFAYYSGGSAKRGAAATTAPRPAPPSPLSLHGNTAVAASSANRDQVSPHENNPHPQQQLPTNSTAAAAATATLPTNRPSSVPPVPTAPLHSFPPSLHQALNDRNGDVLGAFVEYSLGSARQLLGATTAMLLLGGGSGDDESGEELDSSSDSDVEEECGAYA